MDVHVIPTMTAVLQSAFLILYSRLQTTPSFNCGSAGGWNLPTSSRPEPPPPIPTATSPPIPETAATSRPPTMTPKMYFLSHALLLFRLPFLNFLHLISSSPFPILSEWKAYSTAFFLALVLRKLRLPEPDTMLEWSFVLVFSSIIVWFFYFLEVQNRRSCGT